MFFSLPIVFVVWTVVFSRRVVLFHVKLAVFHIARCFSCIYFSVSLFSTTLCSLRLALWPRGWYFGILSLLLLACVVSHETLRFFLYLTSLFRFFSHFFFLMLLVRFSTTKIDCFYPFSLLFSLFFARFFSFFLSQLVVPASRGHRDSDLAFPFSSFRLFCSYFLAFFWFLFCWTIAFSCFSLFISLLFVQTAWFFIFLFFLFCFFCIFPSIYTLDFLFFPLHGLIFFFLSLFAVCLLFFDRFVALMLFFHGVSILLPFFSSLLIISSARFFFFCMLITLGTAFLRLFFFFHSCFAYRSFTMVSFLFASSILFALFLFPFCLHFLYAFLLMLFLYENARSLIYMLCYFSYLRPFWSFFFPFFFRMIFLVCYRFFVFLQAL